VKRFTRRFTENPCAAAVCFGVSEFQERFSAAAANRCVAGRMGADGGVAIAQDCRRRHVDLPLAQMLTEDFLETLGRRESVANHVLVTVGNDHDRHPAGGCRPRSMFLAFPARQKIDLSGRKSSCESNDPAFKNLSV
jgi:hypothetical protein